MEGGLSWKVSKLELSVGLSQNKGTEVMQPCSFSSFFFPLLVSNVASLLPSQAFLIFFPFIFLFLSVLLTSLFLSSRTFYHFQF